MTLREGPAHCQERLRRVLGCWLPADADTATLNLYRCWLMQGG
jgi:hypothetical protein